MQMRDRADEADGAAAAGGEQYEIVVQGHLSARWQRQLAGLVITPSPDGTTRLAGLLPDQAALHGVLSRIRDLGVPLLRVARLPPIGDPPDMAMAGGPESGARPRQPQASTTAAGCG
jgi:hypothetical protein